MSTPARSAPAHNTAVLHALGLGHLEGLTAVDVSLRPNQLPVAEVRLHPQANAITYNLLRAELAPATAPELDLDALADQARMRVDCLLHQRAAHHRGNVREAFADARWRPTERISVRSDRATADAPTRAHVGPKAYPLLPLDNPTHLHALRGGVAMALSLCGLIVWINDTTVRCNRTPPATATVVAKGGV